MLGRHSSWSLLLHHQMCSVGPSRPYPVQPSVSCLTMTRSQP